MSYESTAEPIKVGYLMDFTLPPGFPEELLASFTQTFDLVFSEAAEQGLMDRPVQMIYREVEGLPKGSVKAVIDAYDGTVTFYVRSDPTATSVNYLSRDDLKNTVSLGGSYADPDIDRALAAASRAVDDACNRRFYPDANANSVRYYTPQAFDRILIDDLLTFTSLKTSQFGDGTFTTTWTLNNTIVLEPLNASADGWPYTRIKLNPWRALLGFPHWAPRSVELTGKFGWAAPPAPIVQATGLVAKRLLERSKSAVGIVITTEMATRISSSDPDVRTLLSTYIREQIIL